MNNLIEDNNGNISHKRLINILAAVCAVVLTIGGAGLAIWKGNDIGSNTVALCLGLFGIAAGGAVASNMVEKK